MKGFKSIKEQISSTNKVLNENSILIFITFILTFLINITKTDNIISNIPSYKNLILITYLFTIFLLVILIYQLIHALDSGQSRENLSIFNSIIKELKEFNWILFTFIIFLLMFTAYLFLTYFQRFPIETASTIGMFMGAWISPFLLLIVYGLPIFIAKIVYDKALRQDTLQVKVMLYVFPVLLMGFATPLITYLIRRKFSDILIIPVLVFTIVGWFLFVLAIKDIRAFLKKDKSKMRKNKKLLFKNS